MFRVKLDQLIGGFLGSGEASHLIRIDGHIVRWDLLWTEGACYAGFTVERELTGRIPCTATFEYHGDNLELRDYLKDLVLESFSPDGRHRFGFPHISLWLRWGDMDKTFLVITPIEEEKVDV